MLTDDFFPGAFSAVPAGALFRIPSVSRMDCFEFENVTNNEFLVFGSSFCSTTSLFLVLLTAHTFRSNRCTFSLFLSISDSRRPGAVANSPFAGETTGGGPNPPFRDVVVPTFQAGSLSFFRTLPPPLFAFRLFARCTAWATSGLSTMACCMAVVVSAMELARSRRCACSAVCSGGGPLCAVCLGIIDVVPRAAARETALLPEEPEPEERCDDCRELLDVASEERRHEEERRAPSGTTLFEPGVAAEAAEGREKSENVLEDTPELPE